MKLRHNGRGLRLYEGDVLAVLPSLAARGDEFDAVITDPPYSSGGLYRGDRAAPAAMKYYKAALPNFSGDNRAGGGLWFQGFAGSIPVTHPSRSDDVSGS